VATTQTICDKLSQFRSGWTSFRNSLKTAELLFNPDLNPDVECYLLTERSPRRIPTGVQG